ncbi:hypothetical protein Taro_028836 [Colocasia esculenta]|uniref:sterol 22-desaturase n=1 Tax=Colocasia esculenta TaxID=4460 RepID=A0A843VCB3_COLES|nr:hypothetical protein [Colocasia esculenta]
MEMAGAALAANATVAATAAVSGGGTLVSAVLPWVVALVALVLAWEQLSYLRKKGSLPGPALVVPLLGSAVPMILDPTNYWRRLGAAASRHGLCADYLVGRFIVFLRSADLSHAVFSNVRPDAFQVIGHPFGRKLFGEHNIIYMFGQQHKDLRRRIAPNFTPKALATYLHLQQSIVLSHIKKWVQICESSPSESIPLRLRCRDMNLETSQTVFAGPYLSPEARDAFNIDYNHFNVGLMALPFDFPGFAFRRARLAVSRLVSTLSGCVAESKRRMRSSATEPVCLVDYWMQETLREIDEAELAGTPPPLESGDKEIGGHLFDFLFAAQDASTSSLLWAISLLDSHQEVLARVRAEVSSLWSPSEDGAPWPRITADILREMKYTEAVAREVIRFRPPATMVPHLAARDVPLPAAGYTVPKGTIVFPSLLEASFQGFSEPERFDPDRFSADRQEDRIHKRNFLAFGAGAHQCVGQRYAVNHLVLFISMFVSLVDFRRHRTDGCDDIAYVPTITPRDDCRVYLARRCDRFPDF